MTDTHFCFFCVFLFYFIFAEVLNDEPLNALRTFAFNFTKRKEFKVKCTNAKQKRLLSSTHISRHTHKTQEAFILPDTNIIRSLPFQACRMKFKGTLLWWTQPGVSCGWGSFCLGRRWRRNKRWEKQQPEEEIPDDRPHIIDCLSVCNLSSSSRRGAASLTPTHPHTEGGWSDIKLGVVYTECRGAINPYV